VSEPLVLALPQHAVVHVYPSTRYLETRYADGYSYGAMRDCNEETLRDAEDLGYPKTPLGVWRSLCEHELLHSILAHELYDSPSLVLRHMSGALYVANHNRQYEEAIVQGFQHWINTGRADLAVLHSPLWIRVRINAITESLAYYMSTILAAEPKTESAGSG
jgi:hypothetical protein